MKFLVRAILLAAAVFGAMAPKVALSDNLNPQVWPQYGPPAATTLYGGLEALWEMWFYGTPAAINPALDETGAFAGVNQFFGPVWFLAGNCGGTTVRTVTIPKGKMLFFPIISYEADNYWPGYNEPPNLNVAGLRAYAKWQMDAVTMSCELDGATLKGFETAGSSPYRCTSLVFYSYLQPGNVYEFWNYPPFAPGWYGPEVADGYFLMLLPLSPGHHTLHFQADNHMPDWGHFALDVTYNITVK